MQPERTWRAAVNDAGFTLVEVLVAMAILSIGLLGLAGAMAAQSGGLAISLPFGQVAVTRAHYVSTATFLAQERLEQMKRLEYSLGPPRVDRIGAGAPPAALPDEDFGTIAGFPEFRREATVQADAPGDDLKTVTVTVRYRLPTSRGMTRESLALATIVAPRP